MIGHVDSEILQFATAVAAAGAVGGLVAGLLGVGGGIVIVPVLFHVLAQLGIDDEMAIQIAVGTSLATIVFTSASSMRAHLKRGSVDFGILRSWGPWVAVGVLAGTALAGVGGGDLLLIVFASVATGVAAYMLFVPAGTTIGRQQPGFWIRAPVATSVGGFSAMMGIGGGTLMVPALSLLGFPIRAAVGTASAMGLIIAVPGTIGFVVSGYGAAGLPPFSAGFVNLAAVLVIAPLSMATAPLGAQMAHAIPPALLRRLFSLFLVLSSLRMLAAVES